MLAITAILFAGVIWRYFLVAPLPWTDEVARMLFVWLAFVGAALGVKRGLHASVALLNQRMSPRWRTVTGLFGILVVSSVACVLLVVGSRQADESFVHEAMPVTGISMGWMNIAVPISGLLMLIYLVPHLRRLLLTPPVNGE